MVSNCRDLEVIRHTWVRARSWPGNIRLGLYEAATTMPISKIDEMYHPVIVTDWAIVKGSRLAILRRRAMFAAMAMTRDIAFMANKLRSATYQQDYPSAYWSGLLTTGDLAHRFHAPRSLQEVLSPANVVLVH